MTDCDGQGSLDDLGAGIIRTDGATIEEEIARLRSHGASWRLVAESLNTRRIPTSTGRVGAWTHATARRRVERDAWASYMRQYRAARPGTR